MSEWPKDADGKAICPKHGSAHTWFDNWTEYWECWTCRGEASGPASVASPTRREGE